MGLTHLDAGVLIGFLDRHDAHHRAAHQALAAARDRRDRLAMAASALAECLVAPARSGDTAVAAIRDVVRRLAIDVVPLDEEIAVAAARLRAEHPSLKLPDALVLATAALHGADRLVTTDRGWPAQAHPSGMTVEPL
jgi:predicted nucleic acid-binding protein